MDNIINYLQISNFKSIRLLELTGFKKINLFIGRPNVGKSNLLEAISLFSLPYIWENSPRKLTDIIRLQNQREIFHEGNFSDDAFIRVRGANQKEELGNSNISFVRETGGLIINNFTSRASGGIINDTAFEPDYNNSAICFIDPNLKISGFSGTRQSRFVMDYIKRYTFNPDIKYKERKASFLFPPFGSNLLYVLELIYLKQNPYSADVDFLVEETEKLLAF